MEQEKTNIQSRLKGILILLITINTPIAVLISGTLSYEENMDNLYVILSVFCSSGLLAYGLHDLMTSYIKEVSRN